MYKPLKIGTKVQVREFDRNGKKQFTAGRIGYIMENDSKDIDYKLEFSCGWCGYYYRRDIKLFKNGN